MHPKANRTSKPPNAWNAFFLKLAVAGGLLIAFGRFFPLTGDLAQHFSLVNEIMRYGGVRPTPSLSLLTEITKHGGALPPPIANLGIMAYYPPGAHWLAAIIGWIGGSGFIGIIIVSIGSVYLAYLLIVRLVDPRAPANILLFTLFFLLLTGTHSQIGWEISGNFFYSQLVSDVIYLGSLVWLVGTADPWKQAIFLTASGVVAASIYPLIAAHILGVGLVLITYQCAEHWLRTTQFPRKTASALIFLFIAAIILVLFHPSFYVMRQIAENNGSLNFSYSDPLLVAAACGVIGVASLWHYSSSHTQYADAVLGAAGLASTCLVALQALVLNIDDAGSEYAIKKHMFIVVTVGSINLARLISSKLNVSSIRWQIGWIISPLIAGFMSVSILQTFNTPIVPVIRAIDYAKYAAYYGFSRFVPGNTVDIDDTQPRLINMMISASIFEHHFARRGLDLGVELTRNAKFAMVRRTPEIDSNCNIQFTETHTYAIVPSACLRLYSLAKVLTFGANGNGSFFKGGGWNEAESWGTWSMGNRKAEVIVSLSSQDKGPYKLTVVANAFVNKRHPRQTVLVGVNGVHLATWTYDISVPGGKRSVVIPAQLAARGELKIVFETPDAVSPAQADPGSPDMRVLGLGLISLTLSHDP